MMNIKEILINKKVFKYDLNGNLEAEYKNLSDAKHNNPESKTIIRCLFGECKQSDGNIYVFEEDPRILENGNLDIIEYYIQFYNGKSNIGPFKSIDEVPSTDFLYTKNINTGLKLYDNHDYFKTIVCQNLNSVNEHILFFKTVDEARKATEARCIWGSLLGEVKTTSSEDGRKYRFYFAPNYEK